MISQDTIEQIKNSVVTHEILGSFLKLKKKGSDYSTFCPFHDEKTPSFSISPSKNIYKCFGCGKGGDGITFLMEYQKMSYIEALRWVASKNNIHLSEDEQPKKFTKPTLRIEKPKSKILDWFEKERKITENTLNHFGITEGIEWMPQIQSETAVICFNYYRVRELVNIKFRGAKKSFKMAKDAELIFYNLDAIENEETVYITEGEIDCLSLYECGVENVVSVPNGASVNGSVRLEYLDNCWKYFVDKKKFILVLDNDAAGIRLQNELGRRLGYDRCYIVKYPIGCKDANDVLVKEGKEALLKVLDKCTLYPLEGEVMMEDMEETIIDFYENGYPEGFASGTSNEFDELLKFYPGQLTIITGIPSSGKSEYVDFIMAKLSERHNWVWGVASFECPPEFHVTKLCEKFTDKSFSFRKDLSNRMNKMEFERSLSMVKKHFHFMNLSAIDVTMDGLIAKAEEFVLRYGINGFLFDPWNCIEAKGEGTDYILQCINKLMIFLEKYRVHGFLVAHPTKLAKDKNTGKYDVPTLYNISGSAHFFNRTHNGITVYRNFDNNVVDIYVQKVKYYWLGKQGFCSFFYNTDTRAYTPITGGQPKKEIKQGDLITEPTFLNNDEDNNGLPF